MLLFIEVLVAVILFHFAVYRSVVKNPMAWIADYPPKIRERLIEQGRLENVGKSGISLKDIITKIAIFFLFSFFGVLLFYFVNGERKFLGGFSSMLILMLAVTWYDAIVIDCLWFCNSPKVIIPGTEDMVSEYKNYLFHIKASLLGSVLALAMAAITGGGIELLGIF